MEILEDKPLLRQAMGAMQQHPPGEPREKALRAFYDSLPPAKQEQLLAENEAAQEVVVATVENIQKFLTNAAEAITNAMRPAFERIAETQERITAGLQSVFENEEFAEYYARWLKEAGSE